MRNSLLACLLVWNTVFPVYGEEPQETEPAESVAEEAEKTGGEEQTSLSEPAEESAEPDQSEVIEEAEQQEETVMSEQSEQQEETAEQEETETELPSEEIKEEAEKTEISEEPAAPEESEESEKTEEPDESEDPALPYPNRLIVMSEEQPREEDKVISNYEGIYLLGYQNEEELQEGYQYYSAHALHAEIDGVVTVAEGEENTSEISNEISEENNPIDQLQELLAEPEQSAANSGIKIALIDTGAKADCPAVTAAVSLIGDNPSDDNGHGSRMIDYILDSYPEAQILSVKAIDSSGTGTFSTIYAGMEYAVEQGVNMIVLCSSAYTSEENSIILSEIDKAAAAGIMVVGSAGNNGSNTKYFVPARSEAAIIAGSCDAEGTILEISNYGASVDWLVHSDSTSEAAARLAGILANHIADGSQNVSDPRLFRYAADEDGRGHGETTQSDDTNFHAQCTGFFYGDAYYWEIPFGETTTANAKLISGQQQEILNSKTDTANGYNVMFQKAADGSFASGHGYAFFCSTHKEDTVSSWDGDVHIDDFRGSYEAWGEEFSSARQYSIRRKNIPDYAYKGVIVSQNSSSKPGTASVSALSKAETAEVKLGETGAIYWTDVPDVNEKYWEGWEHTSAGEQYNQFRVDFYYQKTEQPHNLTINYLEEGTGKVLKPKYGPSSMNKNTSYSVNSPSVAGYELVNAGQSVIAGTMPDQDVTINVYYRKLHTIKTKVINGTITLTNAMEQAGQTGDSSYNAEGAVTDIRIGSAKTIRYNPRPGYVLDYVMTDGTKLDIKTCMSSYTFSNIQADHRIEVRYAENPVPADSKTVKNASGRAINGKMVLAGDVLTYGVTVQNTFADKKQFIITDRIPENTRYVEGSASDQGAVQNGVLTWKFELEKNTAKTISFKVTVLPEAKGTIIRNCADVQVNQAFYKTNTVTNPVLPDPIKAVTDGDGKDLNGLMVNKTEQLHYQVTVHNPAAETKQFTVKDVIQPGQIVNEAAISDGGTLQNGVITWNISVPANSKKTVSFETVPDDWGLTIPNTASVTTDSLPEVETNRTIVYTPEQPVKTAKSSTGAVIDGKSVLPGEPFTYEIAVRNNSNQKKTYQVSDEVPGELTVLMAGEMSDGYQKGGAGAGISGQTVTWNMELNPDETKTLFIRVVLKESSTEFFNTARACADRAEVESNTVKNWAGKIIINAEIEEYWEPFGKPSFLYEIKDQSGSGEPWHRMIIIDPASRKGQAVFDIPTGHDADTWVIRDIEGSRYRFVKAEPETTNVTTENNISRASITPAERTGITDYYYRIQRWDETSHMDAAVNQIKYRRD